MISLVSQPRHHPLIFLFKVLLCCVALSIVIISQKLHKPIHRQLQRESKRAAPVPKYILLWTAASYAPFYYLGKGSEAFKRCPISNCYVTNDKKYFKGNLTKFDAIAFNGRNLKSRFELPKVRSPHQKYIFFNMESPAYYPVCSKRFDGFFNWTATYKLNSDIVFPYLLIKNRKGEEVGPKRNMMWSTSKISENLAKFKTKPVMWLASNCHTKSKREVYVRLLNEELQSFNLTVDKYGTCANSTSCPKGTCDSIIKKYYFYLSFENSLAEDYVTEKVYNALVNGVVPVVFGGADYTRFLPPGSYLDAMKLKPREVASIISAAIDNPSAYNNFFTWRRLYTYHRPETFENVCRVCSALNNETMLETTTVYKNFRYWWNPDFVNLCR